MRSCTVRGDGTNNLRCHSIAHRRTDWPLLPAQDTNAVSLLPFLTNAELQDIHGSRSCLFFRLRLRLNQRILLESLPSLRYLHATAAPGRKRIE